MNIHNRARTILRICLILAPVIAIVAITLNAFDTRGRVEVFVAPSKSSISVDGKDARSGSGALKLSPGTYKITASSEGFESVEKELVLEDGREDLMLTFILTPVATEAFTYVSEHQKEFLEIEAKAGEALAETGASLHEKYPIITKLPYRSLLFNIDYKQPSENEVILEISASSPIERSYAIKQIGNWGFSPHDYRIEFANIISNPFMEGENE